MWPSAVLTGDRINDGFFFYMKMYGCSAGPKKVSGCNNEVAVR